MDPTRLWFLRHGEVESPWVGKFIGRTDVGLSPLGHHQAEALKEYLRDAAVDGLVTSPRRRSRDTLSPLAKHLGVKPHIHEGFGEMDFGEWEGLDWSEIVARDGAVAREWEKDPATIPPPGGESGDLFYERIEGALEELRSEFRGRSVVLAAHAGTNRAILAHLLKRPYMDCFVFAQDYGCVNAVGWDSSSGFGQVARVNFVPGPKAQEQGD